MKLVCGILAVAVMTASASVLPESINVGSQALLDAMLKAKSDPRAIDGKVWKAMIDGTNEPTIEGEGYSYDIGSVPNINPDNNKVFGGAAAKDGAKGTGEYAPGCYAKFGTRAASPEFMYGASRNNMAKCKEICDASGNQEACDLVTYAEEACPVGQAKIYEDDDLCHRCETDDDFRRGQGCGLECEVISCKHSQATPHTCPSQTHYENVAHDNTHPDSLPWDTHKFFYGPSSLPGADRRSDIGIGQTNCADTVEGFHSTRTTYPRGRGEPYNPDMDAERGLPLHRTQEDKFCNRGFNGHKCKVGAFGVCKCYPTKKPLGR